MPHVVGVIHDLRGVSLRLPKASSAALTLLQERHDLQIAAALQLEAATNQSLPAAFAKQKDVEFDILLAQSFSTTRSRSIYCGPKVVQQAHRRRAASVAWLRPSQGWHRLKQAGPRRVPSHQAVHRRALRGAWHDQGRSVR